MSLRLRFVALVVGAVLLTLVALSVPGRRIALQEFEASVHAIVRDSRSEATTLPTDPVAASDPSMLERNIRSADTGGETVVWVDETGRVRASNDPMWEGAQGSIDPEGAVILESESPRGRTRLKMAGGQPVFGVGGAPAGRVLRFPSEALLDDSGAAFSAALDRRLMIWAGLLLAGSVALAVLLVGHVLAPLRRLSGAARRITAGDLGARVGSGGPPELREVADAFDTMAQHLEASEAARRRMIRDVAHDLRTPLTNLRGQIEAMQDGLRPPDVSGLSSLHEEASTLARLVSDLEELARADEGRLGLEATVLDLGPLVERIVDGFVQSGRLAAARLRLEIEPGLLVYANPAGLGRALRNVLDNTVVHAPGAGVSVTATREGDHVRLSVHDTGPGIDPQHLPRVTERLYRADPSRNRESGGSGLGLAIATELTRATGGELTVESELGHGVEVIFRIPGAGMRDGAYGSPSVPSA